MPNGELGDLNKWVGNLVLTQSDASTRREARIGSKSRVSTCVHAYILMISDDYFPKDRAFVRSCIFGRNVESRIAWYKFPWINTIIIKIGDKA